MLIFKNANKISRLRVMFNEHIRDFPNALTLLVICLTLLRRSYTNALTQIPASSDCLLVLLICLLSLPEFATFVVPSLEGFIRSERSRDRFTLATTSFEEQAVKARDLKHTSARMTHFREIPSPKNEPINILRIEILHMQIRCFNICLDLNIYCKEAERRLAK